MAVATQGKVYLIGAGPGEPGLLTLRGREVLRQADAVVYDYLANPVLLQWANPQAEIIYAGKRAGVECAMSQAEINALLVRLGQQGKRVARLKGGDPFVFGRGAEEALALREGGVDYEVVPGVSSAIAAAAYAGIPVTHRDFVSSFTVITGHEDPTRPASESRLDWEGMVQAGGTLVFLMGVGHLESIVNGLLNAGQASTTPVAIVRWGSSWQQETLDGSLSNIVQLAQEARIKPPAIIIVGQVVGLRPQLQWFDKPAVRPLLGKRIVLAVGPAGQREATFARRAVHKLNELGAHAVEFPVTRSVPPTDLGPLDEAVTSLHRFDWLLFDGATSVTQFWQRLERAGKDSRALAPAQLGATDQVTAAALKKYGLTADITARPAALASKLAELGAKQVLLLQPEEASHALARRLHKDGAQVTSLVAYRHILAGEDERPGGTSAAELVKWLESGQVDLLSFSSASAVRHFATTLATLTGRPLAQTLSQVQVACLAPSAAKAAQEQELRISLEVSCFNRRQLVEAVTGHFQVG